MVYNLSTQITEQELIKSIPSEENLEVLSIRFMPAKFDKRSAIDESALKKEMEKIIKKDM